MRKFGGFRLGRRLVGVWKWALRPQRRRYPRVRLGSGSEKRSLASRLLGWALGIRGGGGQISCDRRKLLEEEEGCGVGDVSPPPKGHLAVYVREEWGPPRRYLVPVIYFNHPLFGELLREAEAEFGFEHPGGITIPCPASTFKRVWTRIAAGRSARIFAGC